MFPVTQFFRGQDIPHAAVVQGGRMLPVTLLFRVPDVPYDPILQRTGCFRDLVLQGAGCSP